MEMIIYEFMDNWDFVVEIPNYSVDYIQLYLLS